MPFPPSSPASAEPTPIARASSEVPDREKALPQAPSPIVRTASEPPTYLSPRGPPDFGDPRTRSEQREAARRAAEAEERAARREEAARQARIKARREKEAQQAEEEERMRREQVERDLARKAAARMAREEEERAEEERRAREREERRRRDAEKRAELARKLEEWRIEEASRLEEVARAEDELKRKAVARREAARVAAAKRRRDSNLPEGSVILSGWVTVQNSGSVAWRRRYFQLTDTVLRVYNRDKVSRVVDWLKTLSILREHRTSPVSPWMPLYLKAQAPRLKSGTKDSRNSAQSPIHLPLFFPMASLLSCSFQTLLQKRSGGSYMYFYEHR